MTLFKVPKKSKEEKLARLSAAQRAELDRIEADAIASYQGDLTELESALPTNVLQEMGAWESEGMVRRYAHLASAHLAEHAERIAGLVGGTDLAQPATEKGSSES